jgi:hypothetical protein
VWWVRLIDLNGDGHLDIATNLGISGPHLSPYFLNDGTGHFVPLPDDLGLGPLETYALVDLGGDRGLDIVNGGKDPAITLARATPAWASRRLYLTLGPDNYLSFINKAGRSVRIIRPGYHEIVVWNRSPGRSISLRGAGIDQTTTASNRIEYWQFIFKGRSRYRIQITNPDQLITFKTSAR